MKKYIFSGLILTVLVTCWGDITQKMRLQNDGSGKLHLEYDMTEIMILLDITDAGSV